MIYNRSKPIWDIALYRAIYKTQGLSAAQLEQLQLILPSLVFLLNVHLVV